MIYSANSRDDERNTAVSIDGSSGSGLDTLNQISSAHTLLVTSVNSVIHVNVRENMLFYATTDTH